MPKRSRKQIWSKLLLCEIILFGNFNFFTKMSNRKIYYLIIFCPPISHTVILKFWKTISSTLNPIVGIVQTFSPNLILYNIVVLPAASKPTMLILDGIFPNNFSITWLNKMPILKKFLDNFQRLCQVWNEIQPLFAIKVIIQNWLPLWISDFYW